MSFDNLTVVVDAGSSVTKAGFAGEHFPRALFPTVLGRFRHCGASDAFPDVYFGHEAIQKRGISNLVWPVEDGLIKKWDDIEKLWYQIFFKELYVPPEKSKVLHAVHPLVPKGDREKMAEIFFESFSVEALNLVRSSVLSLYASGRTTGVVYENGAANSFITPIFEGYPLLLSADSCVLTGHALSDRLIEMLNALGYYFSTSFERDVVDDVKSKLCYVAQNYKEECEKYASSGENQVRFALPSGEHILIAEERFKCPEVLFQPRELGNINSPSIVDKICNCIEKTDEDIRVKFYENIVLSGAATMFPGFGPRLLLEMTQRVKRMPVDMNTKVGLDELPNRQTATWIGGSLMASLDQMKDFWMTRQEYEDIGPDRVNYKFY